MRSTSSFDGVRRWQQWPSVASAVPGVTGVTLNTVGRATAASIELPANGYFQLVASGTTALCTVTSVQL